MLRPKSHVNNKNRLYDPEQKARGSLKRRDFENYALCSLLPDRCRPIYRRHILYAFPAYRVLAFSVKCTFLSSAYFLTTASHKRMRLTTSFYGIIMCCICILPALINPLQLPVSWKVHVAAAGLLLARTYTCRPGPPQGSS